MPNSGSFTVKISVLEMVAADVVECEKQNCVTVVVHKQCARRVHKPFVCALGTSAACIVSCRQFAAPRAVDRILP
jgi:hypothetical protein